MNVLLLWIGASVVFLVGYVVGCAYTRRRIEQVVVPVLDKMNKAVAAYLAAHETAAHIKADWQADVQRTLDRLPAYRRN